MVATDQGIFQDKYKYFLIEQFVLFNRTIKAIFLKENTRIFPEKLPVW